MGYLGYIGHMEYMGYMGCLINCLFIVFGQTWLGNLPGHGKGGGVDEKALLLVASLVGEDLYLYLDIQIHA